MNVKHKDIEIIPDNPFVNCKLGRKLYADILTNIVSHSEGGFTLSLVGDWGSGKTTFVKMWKQMLDNQGYKTLYLNAWSCDFVEDPLIAIFNGLIECIPPTNKEQAKKAIVGLWSSISSWRSWKDLACRSAKGVTSIIAGEQTAEAAADFLTGGKSYSNDEIAKMLDYQSTIDEFKKSIQALIHEGAADKPVIVMVDELDRCKPDYAILYLERIKHFFDIDGVIFVLSIDKKQLCASVKGYYGSDAIDAEEYLRRFIDLEFFLPAPDMRTFCAYMYEYYGYDTIYNKPSKRGDVPLHEIQSAGSYFLEIFTNFAITEQLTLRQVEKFFAQAYIACASRPVDQTNYIIGLMVFLKMFHTDIYDLLKTSQVSAQELIIVYYI